MLRMNNLKFSYSTEQVLKGVNLKLKKGIGCLLGPNGAGKSTLLKCITGILKPQAGEIELDAKDILSLHFRERARWVSYAPQEFSVNFPYTVFEVVLMGRNPHAGIISGPKEEDKRKTTEALQALGISHLKGVPFTSLSGGQRRLVLIARALAQDGALLVFDEPTSFLDFKNQITVLSVIGEISERTGKIVLLSLHDPNLALLFCDEVFLMKEGKILKCGKSDEVINEENMHTLYMLKVNVINVKSGKMVVPTGNFIRNSPFRS